MSRRAPEPKAIAVADAADTGAVALAEKTGASALVLDADGVDLDLNAATAALSRATSGIGVEATGTVLRPQSEPDHRAEGPGRLGQARAHRRADTLLR